MAIVLDETTRAEYLAQSVAATRAGLVVSALSGAVAVEIFDGTNTLRASGTMATPWASASGATVTVGEVNGAGVVVTSGGVPDSLWYCQLRSGTRFVRGTFGVAGSGRDFTWSLSTFQTGSRGTLGTVTFTATGTTVQPSASLVQASDLVYKGAFALPLTGSPNYTYGAQALAYNPANNSLFMTGFAGWSVGEFTIPSLSNQTGTNNISALQNATHIQAPVDGGASLFTPTNVPGDSRNLKGLLVYNGKLIMAGASEYATTQPLVTHLRRPTTLATTNQYEGPYKVAGSGSYTNGRYFSGYMCHVPSEWQTALGAPVLTGNVASSIVANASDGPSLLAFDPDALASGNVTGTTLLCYPFGAPLFDSQSAINQTPRQYGPLWNWTGIVNGAVIPNGTRSILFFGTNGIGPLTYGAGGTSDPGGGNGEWGYDPTNSSNGEHAYPYRYYCWAYDLNDLIAVKAGTLSPSSVRPYAYWDFTLPFEGTRVSSNPDTNPDTHSIGGCAYDPATRRLYVAQGVGDSTYHYPGGFPIIHVFEIANAVAA